MNNQYLENKIEGILIMINKFDLLIKSGLHSNETLAEMRLIKGDLIKFVNDKSDINVDIINHGIQLGFEKNYGQVGVEP